MRFSASRFVGIACANSLAHNYIHHGQSTEPYSTSLSPSPREDFVARFTISAASPHYEI